MKIKTEVSHGGRILSNIQGWGRNMQVRPLVVAKPNSSSIAGMNEGLADGGTNHKQRR
jgi:hypothetical protein